MTSSAMISLAQPTMSEIWEAKRPMDIDFSWGFQLILSVGTFAKHFRVVCISFSNSARRA
jgi:hypothetical protein